MSSTVLKQLDSIMLGINVALLLFNAWDVRRIRRLNLELQASSEIERRFQAWLASRDQPRDYDHAKPAIPM